MKKMTDEQVYITLELMEMLAVYDATYRGNNELKKELELTDEQAAEALEGFTNCPIEEPTAKFITEWIPEKDAAIEYIDVLKEYTDTEWVLSILEGAKKYIG